MCFFWGGGSGATWCGERTRFVESVQASIYHPPTGSNCVGTFGFRVKRVPRRVRRKARKISTRRGEGGGSHRERWVLRPLGIGELRRSDHPCRRRMHPKARRARIRLQQRHHQPRVCLRGSPNQWNAQPRAGIAESVKRVSPGLQERHHQPRVCATCSSQTTYLGVF